MRLLGRWQPSYIYVNVNVTPHSKLYIHKICYVLLGMNLANYISREKATKENNYRELARIGQYRVEVEKWVRDKSHK